VSRRTQDRSSLSVATAAPLAVASLLGVACSSCFVAGTLVSTPDGPRPIESLRVGDLVWSYALAEGRPVARPLIAVHSTFVREARRVELDHGRVLQGVTSEHPVFSPKTGLYFPVSRLREGDTVATFREDAEHALATVARVVATEVPTPTIQVFNLSVAGGDQNYFADGVLVHNKSAPTWPDCTPEEARAQIVAVDASAGTYELRITLRDPNGTSQRPLSVSTADARELCAAPTRTDYGWSCVLTPLAPGTTYAIRVRGEAPRPEEAYCSFALDVTVVTPNVDSGAPDAAVDAARDAARDAAADAPLDAGSDAAGDADASVP
jgi:hypothetical protein